MNLKQNRVARLSNANLPAAKYGLVPVGEPILKGFMLKKNRYFMKQEREFELYLSGEIKYFNGNDLKGTMDLTSDAQARKISKTEIEINLPANKKNYYLIQKDPKQCPPDGQNFSCKLDTWIEAMNYVIEHLKKEEEDDKAL